MQRLIVLQSRKFILMWEIVSLLNVALFAFVHFKDICNFYFFL